MGENVESTLIEQFLDENLKMELRYISRRALLLFFKDVPFLEEFVPPSFAKISTTVELRRSIVKYL